MKKTEQEAIAALKEVMDPELHIDIYSLELIQRIEIDQKNKVKIVMTLTSPLCPYGPELIQEVIVRLRNAGFIDPTVEVSFDPPWDPSDTVKMMLGLL